MIVIFVVVGNVIAVVDVIMVVAVTVVVLVTGFKSCGCDIIIIIIIVMMIMIINRRFISCFIQYNVNIFSRAGA